MKRNAVLAFLAVAIIGVVVAGSIFALDREVSGPKFNAVLQERCARQAEHVFAAEGWPLDGSVVNDSVAHYASHFYARLGRCLMLVASTTSDPRDRETRKHYIVGDAFGQATYAEYFETALPGFSTAVLQCVLTVPKEKPVFCHSDKEWNRLVKPYIETGVLTR